jgi:hypothetical protein
MKNNYDELEFDNLESILVKEDTNENKEENHMKGNKSL